MTLNTTMIQNLAKSDATETFNDFGADAARATLAPGHDEASEGLVSALGGEKTCKYLGCTEATMSLALEIFDVAYKASTRSLLEPREVAVVSVEAEESDDVDAGAAYWVTATIGGTKYRLYAGPAETTGGRNGRLVPCGSSVDDWCPSALVSRYGTQSAVELGKEAIAMARI